MNTSIFALLAQAPSPVPSEAREPFGAAPAAKAGQPEGASSFKDILSGMLNTGEAGKGTTGGDDALTSLVNDLKQWAAGGGSPDGPALKPESVEALRRLADGAEVPPELMAALAGALGRLVQTPAAADQAAQQGATAPTDQAKVIADLLQQIVGRLTAQPANQPPAGADGTGEAQAAVPEPQAQDVLPKANPGDVSATPGETAHAARQVPMEAPIAPEVLEPLTGVKDTTVATLAADRRQAIGSAEVRPEAVTPQDAGSSAVESLAAAVSAAAKPETPQGAQADGNRRIAAKTDSSSDRAFELASAEGADGESLSAVMPSPVESKDPADAVLKTISLKSGTPEGAKQAAAGKSEGTLDVASATVARERVETPQAERPAPPQPVDTERFMQRVVHFVRAMSSREQSSIEMRMQPPELGSVRLAMSMKDGEVRMLLETTTEAARDVITQNLGQLRETLTQQGYEVARLDVSLGASTADGGARQGGDWNERSGGRSALASAAAEAQGEDTPWAVSAHRSRYLNLVA